MTPQSTGIAQPSITDITPTQTKPAGGCGCTGSATVEMEEKIKERIAKHPCYSEEAHHHYARMHVASCRQSEVYAEKGLYLFKD
jgi:nitrogen fixation protein NifB